MSVLQKVKIEWVFLGITLLFAMFAGGYFVGRNHVGETTTVITEYITAEPESTPEVVSVAAFDDVVEDVTVAESHIEPEVTVEIQTTQININTASLEELETLPGIGEMLAKRIVDYRTEFGDFTTIEELVEVSGIGTVTVEKLRDLISVE